MAAAAWAARRAASASAASRRRTSASMPRNIRRRRARARKPGSRRPASPEGTRPARETGAFARHAGAVRRARPSSRRRSRVARTEAGSSRQRRWLRPPTSAGGRTRPCARCAVVAAARACRARRACSSLRAHGTHPPPCRCQRTTLIPGIKWAPVRLLQAFRNRADMHTAIAADSRVVFMGQGVCCAAVEHGRGCKAIIAPTSGAKVNGQRLASVSNSPSSLRFISPRVRVMA